MENFTFYKKEQVDKLQEYIEENYTLDGTSKRLVRGILEYVQEDDADMILSILVELLDPVGITKEEIVAACKEDEK